MGLLLLILVIMKTQHALLNTASVSGMAMNVDTVFGRATLHGTVRSAEEQAQAETVARAIPGVRAVQDDLRLATATL